jgi:hypothetical protein
VFVVDEAAVNIFGARTIRKRIYKSIFFAVALSGLPVSVRGKESVSTIFRGFQ